SGQPRLLSRGALPPSNQGLPATRRLYLRRTGMGSRFQYRRHADYVTFIATQSALCQPFHEITLQKKHASILTQLFRTSRMALHTLYGVFVAGIILPRLDPQQRSRTISHWSASLLNLLNIRVVVE